MTKVIARQRPDGRWRIEDPPIEAASLEAAARRLRRVRKDVLLEALPALVGVAEAAAILGWDKRRVSTYVARGSFPEPLAELAGGRVWALDDVRAFADRRRA
jgi:hypothetical protein